MAWHCGKDWNNEGLNLGTGRLGQALTLLSELCFLTLRVTIWRNPRGRLKTTLYTQDLEVSKLVEPSFWENGGLLSESLQIQSDLLLLWICFTVGFWWGGTERVGSRADQQVLWGLAFGGHKPWGHGSQAPGDSCKRKGVQQC